MGLVMHGVLFVWDFFVCLFMFKEPSVAYLFPVLVLQRSLHRFQLLEQTKLIELFAFLLNRIFRLFLGSFKSMSHVLGILSEVLAP